MDTGAFVTSQELKAVVALIDILNEDFNKTSSYDTVTFDILPTDVNGETLGQIKRVDGEYRWYPNGEE